MRGVFETRPQARPSQHRRKPFTSPTTRLFIAEVVRLADPRLPIDPGLVETQFQLLGLQRRVTREVLEGRQ